MLAVKGGKALKTANYVRNICGLIGNGATFLRSGAAAISGAVDVVQHYIETGDVDWAGIGAVGLNMFAAKSSASAVLSNGNSLRKMLSEDNVAGKIKNSLGNAAGKVKSGLGYARDGLGSAISNFKSSLSNSISNARSSIGNAFSRVKSRSNSKILFRGDKASVVPDDVFRNGFKPKGMHNNALLHTKSNATAGNFVSTSADKDIATEFAGKNGYVYVIQTDNYIDII